MADNSPETVMLHVLCANLPAPNRFTLPKVPLGTTVGDLKTRISESIPPRPSPDTQKLIYCGKPLVNDGVLLRTVLEPVEVSVLSTRTRIS